MPEPSNAEILAKLIQHDAALATRDAELGHLATQYTGLSGRIDGLSETVGRQGVLLSDLQEAVRTHGGEIAEVKGRLDQHATLLAGLAVDVRANGAKLEEQQATLDSHTATLDSHTAMLNSHTAMLANHGELLATAVAALSRIERRLLER